MFGWPTHVLLSYTPTQEKCKPTHHKAGFIVGQVANLPAQRKRADKQPVAPFPQMILTQCPYALIAGGMGARCVVLLGAGAGGGVVGFVGAGGAACWPPHSWLTPQPGQQ
jgi:hypothetical protein